MVKQVGDPRVKLVPVLGKKCLPRHGRGALVLRWYDFAELVPERRVNAHLLSTCVVPHRHALRKKAAQRLPSLFRLLRCLRRLARLHLSACQARVKVSEAGAEGRAIGILALGQQRFDACLFGKPVRNTLSMLFLERTYIALERIEARAQHAFLFKRR